MKRNQNTSTDSAGLRLQAEKWWSRKPRSQGPEPKGQPTREEMQRLVHELQVHQIELELQNEELLRGRKELEESLERYTELYNDLYDFAPVSYFTLDRDGAIRQVNLTGARLLGVERSRLKGCRFDSYVAAGDRFTFHAFLEKVFVSEVKQGCELSLRRDPDNPFSPQPIVRVEATFREDGMECRAVLMDLTESKRAKVALAESEEHFRTLADSAPDGIFRFDRELKLLYANPVGRHWIGIDALDDLSKINSDRPDMFTIKWEKYAREVFEVGHLRRFETAIDRGGKVWTYEVLVAPELIGDGSIQSVVSVARDITERRMAEESQHRLVQRAQRAQKLESLGVLAGGIAHDFNNLLMGVLGNAELTLLELPADSPVRKYQTKIKTTAERLAEIAKQMLDYSGKGRFIVESVNLVGLVTEMADLLCVSLPKKVALNLDSMPDLLAIEADSSQIRQVVMNLITNAAEAIGDKSGLITIHMGFMKADREYLSKLQWHQELPEGHYAYLEVTDTGCGVTQDALEKIFDPFFTTKSTGRGLGLATVQGIVRGHKGAIQVHSEPGKGSTFRILFPCAEGAIPAAAEQPASEPRRSGAGQRILVVDDEETVRSVTAMLLSKSGLSVLTAEDGEQAVQLLGERPQDFDVVLLDLSMPKIDGIEAFGRMREICPHLPIILSSGYSEQEATRTYGSQGLSGFIQKPYSIEVLLRTIGEVCNSVPRTHADSGPGAPRRIGTASRDIDILPDSPARLGG